MPSEPPLSPPSGRTTPAPAATRALLVVTSPERRGAEVFASDLAHALVPLGVTAELVALVPTLSRQRLDIDVLADSRWSLRGLARLTRRARTVDVLVANGGDTLLPTMVAAALARRPFVYRNVGDPTVWGAARGASVRLGMPLRRAAAVAALYEDAATVFAERYGIRPDRLRVIPNAAPGDRFRPDPDRTPGPRGEQGRWRVAYVGALSDEKRPLLAIAAVAGEERLDLVVVGDGPRRDACQEAAATAPHHNVTVTGPSAEVGAVYAASDVVVIPSRTEGMPAAAIEAGMSGVPVVATRVGGVGHVVAHDETGLLLDDPTPEELAAALLAAAARGAQLGAAAAVRCHEAFSLAAVAVLWRDLLVGVARR